MFEFDYRKEFGRERYYPISPDAITLLAIARREVLNKQDIRQLKMSGWNLKINNIDLEPEN